MKESSPESSPEKYKRNRKLNDSDDSDNEEILDDFDDDFQNSTPKSDVPIVNNDRVKSSPESNHDKDDFELDLDSHSPVQLEQNGIASSSPGMPIEGAPRSTSFAPELDLQDLLAPPISESYENVNLEDLLA